MSSRISGNIFMLHKVLQNPSMACVTQPHECSAVHGAQLSSYPLPQKSRVNFSSCFSKFPSPVNKSPPIHIPHKHSQPHVCTYNPQKLQQHQPGDSESSSFLRIKESWSFTSPSFHSTPFQKPLQQLGAAVPIKKLGRHATTG